MTTNTYVSINRTMDPIYNVQVQQVLSSTTDITDYFVLKAVKEEAKIILPPQLDEILTLKKTPKKTFFQKQKSPRTAPAVPERHSNNQEGMRYRFNFRHWACSPLNFMPSYSVDYSVHPLLRRWGREGKNFDHAKSPLLLYPRSPEYDPSGHREKKQRKYPIGKKKNEKKTHTTGLGGFQPEWRKVKCGTTLRLF